MHDLLMWLIPWMLGYLFNDLIRWLKSREGWHECPISTCEFRIKLTGNNAKLNKEATVRIMTDHILSSHK